MRTGTLRRTLLMACAVALGTFGFATVPTPPAKAAHTAAPVTWTVNGPSPTSRTAARVTLDNGRLTLAVQHGGGAVLAPSPIGIVTDAADLSANLTFTGRADQTVTTNYSMPTGKRRSRNSTFAEARLSFTGQGGARMDLVVRVSDDGAAYRYVLPATGAVTVRSEASSWTLPSTSAAAVLLPHSSDYQGQWTQTTAGGAPAGGYGYPALFTVNGTYVQLNESDLDGRYAGSRLSHESGSATYTTSLENSTVGATGPLSTPWRIAIVGDLAAVTQSTLVDDLAAPSKVGDTSWIRPGKVAWSWLTEPGSPGNAARQRQYIDFAQRNGWPFVLIDEGWNSSWVPDVVNYGAARGVGVILWFNSSELRTAEQREAWLPLVRSWGVAGVKIDYIWENTQPTLKWYDAVLARTAQLRLMVNFHGAEMPRGMQRTWPHVMTAEGIYGAEQQRNRAAFNTRLPFTRNTVSSMDFTPTTFSVTDRDTTGAHEVATFLVFESGWQHGGDNPETYEGNAEALRTLNRLPTAWDETRLLGGQPGREAYLARRDGDSWYVGGISALPAKTYQTALSFLGQGQWMADTLRDGASGTLTRETRVVTSADTLSVPVAANGGFVTILCRYTSGTTGCTSPGPRNLALGKPATADSSCNANETAPKAVNGSVSGGWSDKWCSGGAKWWRVDLGSSVTVRSFTVRHAGAGGESASYNTRDFDIQVSADGSAWTTVVQARGNTANVSTHPVTAVTARYVRLNVVTAEQGGNGAARIYEVEAYS
ncbi:glycoside hydrolase family 97 catalytic domain-containing protein [Nocardia aurea]|uniref:glycoside hydrolase family 97 catalytic domain-containing protein n=1 Tax=Nocardia aurea TaxID=2144174 RepID=UPI000D697FD2|nr:glycoside hydrolase family 97 catalytic domain-containing protein [Nocardia aurea]